MRKPPALTSSHSTLSSSLSLLLLPLLLLPGAHAHGYLSHPPARQAGPATLAACGRPITEAILRDNTSHIEGLPELGAQPGSGYDPALCNLWLCRGIQFADNNNSSSSSNSSSNGNNTSGHQGVQVWTAGQTVGVRVKITIPHDGSANVSIVDAAKNERVGDMLVSWERGYANEREFFEGSAARNQTEFNVTLPDLGERCARAGDCVLQWWWYGKGARQTYESCVDFVIVPSGDKALSGPRSEAPFRRRSWFGLPLRGWWA